MRVCFDDQAFTSQVYGGISRYFVSLACEFICDQSLGVTLTRARWWSKNAYLSAAGLAHSGLPPFLNRRRILQSLNRSAPDPGADLVHHTFYDEGYLGHWNGAVRVTTVYDMIPELLPEHFPGGSPHGAKRRYVQMSSLVICISESTKRDLLSVMGHVAAAIVVIPLAVGGEFTHRPLEEAIHTKPIYRRQPYAMFVGSRGGYKDFAVAAMAISEVRPALRLLVVGGGNLTTLERQLLAKLGISDLVIQRDLNDKDLANAYRGASCLLFPSRYEGFGLPTLEAMASGCPVILANTSSHPEVAAEAGLYIEPGDFAGMTAHINMMSSDEVARARIVASGLARARTFSWHKVASETADAYRCALTD